MSEAARERLFFAIWPSAAERAAMTAAAARLALDERSQCVGAEDYHMTVAFVGEVAAPRLEAVRRIGASAAGSRCRLHFDAYEYWPKPQVVVAAARTIPPSLERLWRELHARLAVLGLALEPKPLRPHVTLVRKMHDAPSLPEMAVCTWEALALCLVRSARSRTMPAYTVVEHWRLLDEMPPD
ncbi:MAG TPA: RNA 2',3'-cyclic phosphodiesterase [Steroidobacteraceae bacterium]|nr:RNA 2',3'-cyclic phosphodiesterase [Steroidobacteraceae bacterium]